MPITPATGTAWRLRFWARRPRRGMGRSMGRRASRRFRLRRLYVASSFTVSVGLIYLIGLLFLVAIVPLAVVALMGAGILIGLTLGAAGRRARQAIRPVAPQTMLAADRALLQR